MDSNDKIHIIAYPIEGIQNHPTIKHLLSIYPSLGGEIEKILNTKNIFEEKNFSMSKISQNNIFDLLNYLNDKNLLIEKLKGLSEILGNKKPIVFLSDGCFTNDLFIRELKEILDIDFDKYVDEVNVSYNDQSKNKHISKYLYENSILILGGSYTNLSDIPDELLDGELVKFIKDVHNNRINSKLIGICWGHQFISHIIGLDEMLSQKIITTHLGEAQFGVMPSKLVTSINNIPYAYKKVLSAITNNGKTNIVSSVLTRTGHVDLDFLNSYRLVSQSLIPLFVDPITGSNRICGSTNSQYFGVQDHFEINPSKDSDILYENINNLIKSLINTYGNKIELILQNIEKQKNFVNDLGKPLYASILLSFTSSIVSKHQYIENINNKNKIDNNLKSNLGEISKKELKKIISEENFGLEINTNEELYNKLDMDGILKMVSYLDWSVSRGSLESSNILGLNLIQLINYHKIFIENQLEKKGNYIFRDLGAGRGKLIDDIENNFNKKNQNSNIITYGVSNFAYFNIYEGLIKLEEFNDIPRNILKIFVEELLINYNNLNKGTEKEKVKKSLKNIKLNSDSYKLCTMFSESITYRFNDQEEKLEENDKVFLKDNKKRIFDLINYIKSNFYKLIVGSYDKMVFADFNSLYIEDKIIKGIDFQTAIRSTCHIDSTNLVGMLGNYVDSFAKPGSIFIDNGVVRSDSGVPRIKEFIDLEKNNPNIKVNFIYDIKTSYITSAIINKAPFLPEEIIKGSLHDGYILLSIEEINNCSFFKIERFFRELMIFTFKDLQFSHDKNKEIIEILKNLSGNMNNSTPDEIKKIIINEINNLIIIINKEYNKDYSIINGEIFDLYLDNVLEDIKQFFKGGKINVPIWFNKNFERNN